MCWCKECALPMDALAYVLRWRAVCGKPEAGKGLPSILVFLNLPTLHTSTPVLGSITLQVMLFSRRRPPRPRVVMR
jgi:hypothetical protein